MPPPCFQRPPFSVVFTDWLSMIAALGVAFHPANCEITTTRRHKAGRHSLCEISALPRYNSRSKILL